MKWVNVRRDCGHKPEMILFYRLSVVLNVVFLLAGLTKLLW